MSISEMAEAIGRAHGAALDTLTRTLWSAHAAGEMTDGDATTLAEAIAARRTLARGRGVQLALPLRKSVQRPPVRSVAIERRRRLAASGPMPPALAAKFTTSEAAVMRIVGDTCRDYGRCVLPIDAIAARAGVSRTTVQNALRLARHLGMVEIEERRQSGAKNLPNRVTITNREWRQWLDRGPKNGGGGFKNLSTTEMDSLSENRRAGLWLENGELRARLKRRTRSSTNSQDTPLWTGVTF